MGDMLKKSYDDSMLDCPEKPMTSKLKCPFCQTELESTTGGWEYGCTNAECQSAGTLCGTQELWQELIQSQKDLQAAKDGLLIILGSTSIGKFTKASIKEICIKTLKQITHETNSLEHKE